MFYSYFIFIRYKCMIGSTNDYYLFLDNLDVLHKSGNVQDLENVISFIEPNRKLVKYNPDTKIKFGSPEATSTIKHKQEQHESM